MPARVNYITIKKHSNSSKSSLLVHLPLNVMDILGDVDKVIVREYPLSISVPTLSDKGVVKITSTDTSGHKCSFNPIGDIDEYIGRYSYEVDDMTLYLEKIQ